MEVNSNYYHNYYYLIILLNYYFNYYYFRTLYRTEQQQQHHHSHIPSTKLQPLSHDLDGNLQHQQQQSRLSSHRSLPDNDSNSQLPKVSYERKSHTERREKKNKNSGKQLPKLPKKEK